MVMPERLPSSLPSSPEGPASAASDPKVAVSAIKGEKALIELAQDFDVHLSPDRACLQ
jgi:hypothetical protein